MSSWEAIPKGSRAVIDSSVLFAMGGPENEKYQAFQRFIKRRNLTAYIPSQVAEELGEAPDAYTFHRDRLRAAHTAGRNFVNILATPGWRDGLNAYVR